MRQAEEQAVWESLLKARASVPSRPVVLSPKCSLDLAVPCIVLGGRNGAGKSRLLRTLAEQFGADGLLIDLHHLCEQALIVLRSRDDFDDMSEEFDVMGPSAERLDDVGRVVGRDYETVEWFALEVEPSDAEVARRFKWSGEQSLVPYFRVVYRGHKYTSREMGLGEFSVHFLFWILELHQSSRNLTLLLDEPDAFLPPVGVSSLLARLLQWCLRHESQVVLTTHSEEMIAQAVEKGAFTLLRLDDDGSTVGVSATDDPSASRELLSRPPVETVFFCEDESAFYLTRALTDAVDRRLSDSVTIVWGNGDAYIRKLREHLPRHDDAEIRFAFVFDGDQRGKDHSIEAGWPTLLLPTNEDPDTLFRSLRAEPAHLALRLGEDLSTLQYLLDSLEGGDVHDWVNSLGDRYGRAHVLTSLAVLWVEANPDGLEDFAQQLASAIN